MKKIMVSIISCCFALSLTAQISIMDNKETINNPQKQSIPQISIVRYDSLQSIILMNDTLQDSKFIGQKLFLPSTKEPITFYTTHFDSIECENTNYQECIFEGNVKVVRLWTNIFKPINKCSFEQYSAITNLKETGIFHINQSSSDTIKNRYYTIIEIYNDDKFKKISNEINNGIQKLHNEKEKVDGIISGSPTIKLKDDLNGDILFYNLVGRNYSRSLEISEFISVGFYSKLKQIYEGKNMIWYLKNINYNGWDHLTDFLKNNSFTETEIGSKFKCTAIKLAKKVDSDYYDIIAVLQNEKGEITLKCPKNLTQIEYVGPYGLGFDSEFIDYITPSLHPNIGGLVLEEDVQRIETDKEFAKYKKRKAENDLQNDPQYQENKRLKDCIAKYGTKNGTFIANHSVTIGMTKAMCKAAGFTIQSSNTTKDGVTEIWVGDSGKIVLKDGLVTRIIK